MINRASVHSAGEFHDGIAESIVTGEDGRLNWGWSTIGRKFRGVEVENAFGFEKLQDFGFD